MDSPEDTVIAITKIELDEKLLGVIETALGPETDTPSSDRSETQILVEDNFLVIKTQATDTTALRASINSYLRWIDGVQNIVESIS